MGLTAKATQSDTKSGDLLFVAGEDLTGKEGYLVELGDGGTKANVTLPNAQDDFTPLLIIGGAENGGQVTCRPFNNGSNHRVVAKGAGSAGVRLVAADPAVAADKGKLRALPAAAGTYIVRAIAEEDFIDGQLVRCRPVSERSVVVP